MAIFDRVIFHLKRSDSPVPRLVKKILGTVRDPTVPPIPDFFRPLLRFVYELHFLAVVFFRALLTIFYRNPVFQGRCARFGKRVRLDGLPYVSGHVEVHLGDDVLIGGKVCIFSGAVMERPKLVLKDRAEVGWGTIITVNSEVILEEDVRVSFDCRISDSDGHPRECDRRAAKESPDPADIRPVRICRHAWVGNGTHILKGVTIGEGAVIAANSVVMTNIPPYTLAVGNPAEVLFRNYGLPSTSRKPKKAKESMAGVSAVDD